MGKMRLSVVARAGEFSIDSSRGGQNLYVKLA
jgi:hypothetical protein